MNDDPDISAFLRDYIGFYTRDSLDRFLQLFLPDATATSVNADGSVTTWSREAFYQRQVSSFATAKPIRESLHNTVASRTGPLVSVQSDFEWSDGDVTRQGRLMLLLVEQHGRLKVQALTFTYAH